MLRNSIVRALIVACGASVIVALQFIAKVATIGTAPIAATAPASAGKAVQPAADSGFPYPVSAQGMQMMAKADDRVHALMAYMARYRVSSTIAGAIYDNALAFKIPADLAFRLVRVESEFNPAAHSNKNALGLTQLLLATAQNYAPMVTAAELLDPNTNLRIGFHYLRDLIRHYNGDLSMALEAYNRGSDRVDALTQRGDDARGEYSHTVLAGVLR